ncbi:MAG: ANTAR domain-containing protein, partial [Nocardioides sp.]
VVIEQAKGVLATSLGIEMEEAFQLLRRRSRDERRRLTELAEEVVQAPAADMLAAYRDRD